MAAKRYTLKDIARSQIEMIVGNMHVGASDEEVAAEIEKRSEGWPQGARSLALKYAIKCHRRNRGLYSDVMGGRIGRGR